MVVKAYSTGGGYTPENQARLLDTNPSNPSQLVNTSFGSPNNSCENVTGPGTGAGGNTTNCDGLGYVLIIQESDTENAVSNPGGGDIVFMFGNAVNMLEVTLFNAIDGALIIAETSDQTSETVKVESMESNSVEMYQVNTNSVVNLTVHFNGVGAIANLGACLPSRLHVISPSPTTSPTQSPSPSPSTSPTQVPPPTGGDCPADIELVAKVGSTQFPQLPITILDQNVRSVRFSVQNVWNETITRIFSQFHATSQNSDTECYEVDNVEHGSSTEYVADCMVNVPITIVDVWFMDDSFSIEHDKAEVPECCHPPPNDKTPVVHYTFKLNCVSECVYTLAPLL
jgi:hypothetical protein